MEAITTTAAQTTTRETRKRITILLMMTIVKLAAMARAAAKVRNYSCGKKYGSSKGLEGGAMVHLKSDKCTQSSYGNFLLEKHSPCSGQKHSMHKPM